MSPVTGSGVRMHSAVFKLDYRCDYESYSMYLRNFIIMKLKIFMKTSCFTRALSIDKTELYMKLQCAFGNFSLVY